jgi:hypothetical protein
MQKKNCLLFLFFLILLLATCVSESASLTRKPVSEGVAATFFNSVSAGNELVFFGVVGKRSDPKETLQFALEDAARRVAAYNRVYGEYALLNNIGSGILDYAYDTYLFLTYDVEGSKQYVDALKFNADTDTIEIENSFIIRTTYPASLPVPVSYRPTYGAADQKPDWVDNPPLEIADYEVGVGYSGRYSSLADTCTNSYHNAVFAIIRNVNSSFRSRDVLYQGTGSLFGYKTANDNVTYSYGILNGFYALDMWINPKDKSVWTLAIAKKSE